jgi:hypothetical protein
MEIFQQLSFLNFKLMKRLILFVALSLSIHSFSQNAKLGLQKGQKIEMTVDTKKATTIELMGQAMESTVNATVTTSYDIKDVNANGTVIEHKVKRLVFTLDGMGQKQNFDSEKEGDLKGDIGKVLEKSIKNKYTVTLDPSGKITDVKLDDDNPNAKPNDENQMIAEMLSSQLGLTIPKVGTLSDLSVLPARKLSQGEKWVDSSSVDGTSRTTNYTVKTINDNEVALDFTELTNIQTTKSIMGTQAVVNSKNTSSGSIVVDKKTGVLKQKTITTDTDGKIEAQGQTIPQKEKATVTITVK